MKIGIRRWRLWEQFRKCEHTNSTEKNIKDPPYIQCQKSFIWSRSSYTMQYWTISPQTGIQMANIWFFRWCWYLRRWSCFSQYQSTNNTSQTKALTINFQNNFWCLGIPRRRWRRGFPDCTLGWQTLDYWRRPQQNFMHTQTFLTTWTMPIPMPICKLPASFLCWDHGFEWHFWFWGYHDHIQWWGHTCTWRFSILKELWFALNIRYWL